MAPVEATLGCDLPVKEFRSNESSAPESLSFFPQHGKLPDSTPDERGLFPAPASLSSQLALSRLRRSQISQLIMAPSVAL